MSYEGYTEYLCPVGHYWTLDVYEEPDFILCPTCNAWPQWRHSVDQTNGYDESDPSTCDAPKQENGFEEKEHQDHRGNKYFTKIMLYKPDKIWAECFLNIFKPIPRESEPG